MAVTTHPRQSLDQETALACAPLRRGDIIRDRYGSWLLYRVEYVFTDGDYCEAFLIVTSKRYHTAGERELLRCAHYQREADPVGFVHRTRGRWGGFCDPKRRFGLALTTERARLSRIE